MHEFSLVKREYEEQKERYEVCIKKMIKDKRVMVAMNDFTNRKFERINSITKVLSAFL